MNMVRYGLIALVSVLCSTASAGSLFGTKPPDPATGSAPDANAPGSAAVLDNTPFDDRFYVAPMFSYAPASNSRHSNDGIGGTLVIGKPIVPHLTVELLGDYLRYKGKTNTELIATNGEVCAIAATSFLCRSVTTHYSDSNLYSGGAGANVYLSRSNSGFFLHADAMYGKRFVYDGGPGLDIPLSPSHRFSLRGEALYHKEANFKAGPEFNLGVLLRFGAQPQAQVAAAAEPVAIVPVQAPPPAPPAPPCELPAPGDTISLAGCKTGDTFVLHGVNFDFNKATLTPNAMSILDQVAIALLARPDLKVEVDGHTDGIGSVAYNDRLSLHRADSVKAYLVSKGIDADHLSTRGFGKSAPIADNSTPEGRDLNRRVELKVTDSSSPVDVPVSSGATEPIAAPPADSAPSAPEASTPAANNSPVN